MTPEGKVKTAVKRMLVELGVYFFMPPGVGYGRAGIPDIVACCSGRFLAIECKAGKGTTTALQDRELALIEEAGGFIFVARENNLEELCDLIEAIRKVTGTPRFVNVSTP
jgi:predicted house-cleaning noncanonical NTP pyrophosphatase (MazG superfamily)